jgi:hypothetical protein
VGCRRLAAWAIARSLIFILVPNFKFLCFFILRYICCLVPIRCFHHELVSAEYWYWFISCS